MDIFRKESKSDLFSFLYIIRCMNLEFTTRRPESYLIDTFLNCFRIKIIIYI